jgi:PmbA protein
MTRLAGKETFYSLADDIIGKCDDAACEVTFFHSAHGLTRLANSIIHQNVHTDETSVDIRVSRGDRIGVASTNLITPAGMLDCLMNALEIMKASEPLEGFPGPAPKAQYKETDTFVESTAGWGPDERARVARDAIARGKGDGLTLAGAVETTVGEIAVANSLGVRAYQPLTSFACNFVAMDGQKDDPPSGYAALTGRDVEKADFAGTYDRACRKAVLGRDPVEIEPGQYDVVLEAGAFCELIEWFNYIALSAKSVQDGMSPLADRFGQKITGDLVTLIDDAYGSISAGLPFDFEGVPRQKLLLIDHGVAKGVAHSRFTAAKEGIESTGHGFGAGAMPSDALPLNIRMQPGEHTLDEMVKMLDGGIQVTRFHYVNGLLDTRKAVMTGMTRDGAWLVEGGKIKHAIKNLRFTDSMLEAWKRIEAVEKECHSCAAWWSAIGAYDIPAVLIRKFTFTGKTGKGS